MNNYLLTYKNNRLMRLIIQPDYQSVSHGLHYVAAKIKLQPTSGKTFCIGGCPTGSSPLGMYKALIDLNKERNRFFPERRNIQYALPDDFQFVVGTFHYSGRFYTSDPPPSMTRSTMSPNFSSISSGSVIYSKSSCSS